MSARILARAIAIAATSLTVGAALAPVHAQNAGGSIVGAPGNAPLSPGANEPGGMSANGAPSNVPDSGPYRRWRSHRDDHRYYYRNQGNPNPYYDPYWGR